MKANYSVIAHDLFMESMALYGQLTIQTNGKINPIYGADWSFCSLILPRVPMTF